MEGDLRVGFTEENGGDRAIINDISQGDVTFFPQGLIHYQQNLGCSPATFVNAFSSEDPGIDTITRSFFNLPAEAVKASMPNDFVVFRSTKSVNLRGENVYPIKSGSFKMPLKRKI